MIVDDHPIVQEGYIQLVSTHPHLKICGAADSIGEAVKVAAETSPDLIVVDLNLKDGSGLELIKVLRTKDKALRMLVVSVHAEALFADRAIRAGANGYINKQNAIEDLVAAIYKVLEGETYLSSKMHERRNGTDNHRAGELSENGSQVNCLSDRELEVLQLLGEGASTKRLARLLKISPKTVDRHRENIKHKLNLAHANDLIRFAASWVLENQ